MPSMVAQLSLQKLPVRPRPIAGEAVVGYLNRVALVNGYESIGQLCNVLTGVDQFKTALKLEIEEIARLIGPYPFKWKITSSGYALDVTKFNSQFLRICPLCLLESPYLRATWFLKLSCVCPQHAVYLSDRCGQCGARQRLGRADYETCPCGATRAKLIHTCNNAALIRLSETMELALLGQHVSMGNIGSLSLDDWFRLVSYLGQFNNERLPDKPGKLAHLNQLEVAQALMCNTAQLLDQWPNNFNDHLQNLYQVRKSSNSIHRVFGSLFQVIYKHLKEPQFDFLRENFEHYIQQHWKGLLGKRNQLFNDQTVVSHNQMSLRQAAKQANAGISTVRHLVQTELVKAQQSSSPSGRKTIAIPTAQLEDISKLASNNLSLQEVASLLGLSKTRVRQLIHAGLIVPLINPKAVRAAAWLIPRQSLSHLEFEPKTVANAGIGVSITQILQHWRLIVEEFIALIQALINKELSPIGTIATPIVIGKVQLNRSEFQQWLDGLRFKATQSTSVDKAAKSLGLKQQVVYELVAVGLLESTRDQIKGYRISLDQIRHFQESFISLAELARLKGSSPKKLLMEMDVRPISGPVVNGTRQYFYRRSDVN